MSKEIYKILNEILLRGQTNKEILGQGSEQNVYNFNNNPDYVIKVLRNNDEESIRKINKSIKIFQKYPEISPKTSDLKFDQKFKGYYYMQEKVFLIPEYKNIEKESHQTLRNLFIDKKLYSHNKIIQTLPQLKDVYLRLMYLDILILSKALNQDIGIKLEDLGLKSSQINLLEKIILFTKKVIRITGQIPDIHEDNIGYNKKGKMKIFDI